MNDLTEVEEEYSDRVMERILRGKEWNCLDGGGEDLLTYIYRESGLRVVLMLMCHPLFRGVSVEGRVSRLFRYLSEVGQPREAWLVLVTAREVGVEVLHFI